MTIFTCKLIYFLNLSCITDSPLCELAASHLRTFELTPISPQGKLNFKIKVLLYFMLGTDLSNIILFLIRSYICLAGLKPHQKFAKTKGREIFSPSPTSQHSFICNWIFYQMYELDKKYLQNWKMTPSFNFDSQYSIIITLKTRESLLIILISNFWTALWKSTFADEKNMFFFSVYLKLSLTKFWIPFLSLHQHDQLYSCFFTD